ncbi:hypothetical protein GQ457_01G026540 [Hibiscus cannabinus]
MRFEQYQKYEKNFGFLFTSHKLQSLNDITKRILACQKNRPPEILRFLKGNIFSNAIIAYRILGIFLPISRVFKFRKKIHIVRIHSSTMSQERLNRLSLIAIENDILKKVDYEDFVEDFASKSIRRMQLFK